MANSITVTCPDHHKILVDGLWNLLTTKYLVDFAIDWNGRTVRAHQLILDVFLPPDKLALSNSRRRRGDLNLLLEFMYSGKVDVRREQVEDTLGVARMLDFKLMVDALEAAIGQVERAGSDPPSLQVRETVGTTPKTDDGVVSAHCSTGGLNLEVDIPDESGSDGVAVETFVITAKAQKLRSIRRPDSNLVMTKIDSSSIQIDENGIIRPTIKSNSTSTAIKSSGTKPAIKNNDTKQTIRNNRTKSTIENDGTNPTIENNVTNPTIENNSTNPTIENNGINPKRKYKLGSSKNSEQDRKKIKLPLSLTVFECPTCKLPYPDKTTLARHCQLRHLSQRDQVFQCPHCEYKNRYKELCEIHMRRRHGDPNGELLRCDKCSMAFLDREKYENHLNNHRPHQCQHCTFVTEKKWSYENHLFREHGLSVTGKPRHPHQCTQCPYQGKNAAVLRYHIAARHSTEKPFKCTVDGCPYAAFSKKAVEMHVRFKHLDDKNFMCEFCSSRMRSAAALEIHRRSHTGEKPYQCTICERCFSTRNILSKHITSHVNAKPFLCHLCSYACNRRDNLRAHLKGKHKSDIGSDELAAL